LSSIPPACQLKIKSALFLDDLKIKSALISGLLLKELAKYKKIVVVPVGTVGNSFSKLYPALKEFSKPCWKPVSGFHQGGSFNRQRIF
jgi:hypothetical protein